MEVVRRGPRTSPPRCLLLLLQDELVPPLLPVEDRPLKHSGLEEFGREVKIDIRGIAGAEGHHRRCRSEVRGHTVAWIAIADCDAGRARARAVPLPRFKIF